MAHAPPTPRRAKAADAVEIARLLHDFNVEFETPSPGVEVLAARLRSLLPAEHTVAVLVGRPSLAVALVTLRPNVWFDGPVALLDELYVVPAHRGEGLGSAVLDVVMTLLREAGAEWMEVNVDEGDTDARRFYERHGFSPVEPHTGEQALYYSRPLV